MKTTIVKTEYQGISVSFTDEGWFNATAAAKKFGKAPNEWLRLPDTEAYLKALESRYGKIPYVKTNKARADRGGGTWLHPKLAVRFAQWLSVDFSIWCDEQIDRILRREPVDMGGAESELSTIFDREPLLTAAVSIVVHHHLPFSTVYQTLNHFAGASRFKGMTKQQVRETAQFVTRFLTGSDTRKDWDRIEQNRKALAGPERQPTLAGLVIPPWSAAVNGGAA